MKATAIGRRIISMLTVPVLFIIGFALLGATAYGQASSNIVGTVSDPTGAVVPNAKITITNMDNGFVRVTTSNSTGNYSARDLQIGRYQIQAEAQGFKTFVQKNLVLNVGDTDRVDAVLQVGAVGQTVTVEAAALQVQSETNDVSTTINADQIENLGTNGRNIKQLTALVPGASSQMPDFDSPGAQFQSTSINFNGMRSDDNNWVIDGGEAHDAGGGGILIVAPSEDALTEFTISTSNMSADMGDSSGGMTTMAVKSGTKKFHAGAWEYNRNDALDAWAYYDKQTKVVNPAYKKAELRLNEFGFNAGGPVQFKSSNPKTFWFYNQEWRRMIQGGGIHNKVLTQAELNGDESAFLTLATPYKIFVPMVTSQSPLYAKILAAGLQPGQQFPNNVIPASMINANTAAYIKAGYFLPPNDSSGVYYNSNANQATYFREEIARGDHQFNEKYSIFGHLIYDSLSQSAATVSWTGNTFPTIGSLETVPSWAAVVHFTANFTPHLLNEIAYNENGNDITIANTGPLVKAPSGWSPKTLFASNTANKIPDINMGGGPISESMDSSNWPWQNWWRSNQIKDDISYVHGTHNFKAGFGWLWTSKKQQLFANTAGSLGFYGGATSCSTSTDPFCPSDGSNVNGMGIADFLLGAASSYSQSELQDFVNIHFNTIDAYAMDDWRVTHKLTLNLGLRWEGLPHSYDANGRASNFYPNLFNKNNAAWLSGVGQGGPLDEAKDPTSLYKNASSALCSPSSTAATCAGAPLGGFKTGSSLGVTLSNDTFYMNGVGLAGKNGIPKGLISPHYYNFGPRIGFALDVFGNHKTVLRGGAGGFFTRNAGNEEYNMGTDLPFSNNGSSGNAYLDNLSQSYINGSVIPPAAITAQGFTGLQAGEPITDVYQWSVGLQEQLQSNIVATLGYVGNASAHLSDTVDINTMRGASTATRTQVCGSYCGAGNTPTNNIFRPYQGWSGINLLGDEENSHYGSLQATLRASEWHRVNLGMAYTYGHVWDGIDGQIWNNISDPLNPSYDKGTAGFDRRQVLAVNFDYTLPNFGLTGIAKTALAGWTIAGIGNVESGLPANVGNNGDPTGCGGDCSSRANQKGPVSYIKSKSVVNSNYKWVDLSPFSSAAPLTYGNAPKNSLKGIGRNDWNISLRKEFKFAESASFTFVAESFNTFNHTQFSGFDTGYQGSTPGQVNGVQSASFRTFQLGARASF